MSFVSVILPLRLDWEPCYKTDAELQAGARVRVPFAHREYVGVVHKTGVVPEVDISRVQEVTCTDTGLAAVSPEELRLWEFLAEYCLCSIGEVYKLASPLLKLRSEVTAVEAARRSIQRAEATRDRMRGSLQARVERLEARLERKKAEINRREQLEKNGNRRISHDVSETLKGELISVAAELSAARSALAKLMEEPQEEAPAEAPADVDKPVPGKTRLTTGPGRFDRYVEESRQTLSRGLDVLLLVPEIAASEILEKRLSDIFPSEILTCTSKATPAQRRRVADTLRFDGLPHLVIGTRTSLFLPFRKLGLVIVENEQDSSYKQTEPAPRFNARDAALMLARIHSAQSLLGAAFPSLESVYNCLSGKYSRLEEKPAAQADISIIDVSEERKKNGMRGLFSVKLIEQVRAARGPVAFIRGWEKQEDLQNEIEQLFPDRETVILTYNEAKHIDLSPFALVALMQADVLLGKNDFRCDERALQTLYLLREQPLGSLVVQTAKSGHQLFSPGVERALLVERKDFRLPPFRRLVDVIFIDENSSRLAAMSSRLKGEIRPSMEMPGGSSLTLRYSFDLGGNLGKAKNALKESVHRLEKDGKYYGHITIDVDPV